MLCVRHLLARRASRFRKHGFCAMRINKSTRARIALKYVRVGQQFRRGDIIFYWSCHYTIGKIQDAPGGSPKLTQFRVRTTFGSIGVVNIM